MSKNAIAEQLVRDKALSSLEYFIKLVHPMRCLGDIHREVIEWWTRQEASTHSLLLLPRDHMKSGLLAYRIAWEITKDPTTRVLLISSTALLATKQLKFIKDILTSKIYQRYWPEMVNTTEGKREKWTETEISIDHPLRKEEAVRDPTVIAVGLTTNIAGLHSDINALDDVVVNDNAYTEEGREKVRTQYSFLNSVLASEGIVIAVGTRYHPKDLYQNMKDMNVDEYNEYGEVSGSYPLYECFERRVEDMGDGTGEFLWPRMQRYDGKWFGFDRSILAKKRTSYLDRLQFRAQYYNDPNDPESNSISRDNFQYYDQAFLTRHLGKWFFREKRLNVFAAVDFAFSLRREADYTSIIVVGVDSDYNYYVLDIDRFKTNQIKEYFNHILSLHQKWDFRKIRAEVTVAQETIVEELKNSYIRKHGLALSIDKYRPTGKLGTKEERVDAILRPRYENLSIWHYRGGNCQVLEEELLLQRPPHDDVKDSLASCVDLCVAPSGFGRSGSQGFRKGFNVSKGDMSHSRFGGIQ